jgi:hypothetical protein
MKYHFYPKIIFVSLLLVMTQCQNKLLLGDNDEQFDVRQVNNSLMLGEHNEIAELVLNLSKSHFLKEINLNIASGDTLESLWVYHLLDNEGGMERMPIAAMNEVIGDITIYLDKDLPAGEHKFLISVFPKEASSADDVRVNFNHFTSDKGLINNSRTAETSTYTIKRMELPTDMFTDLEIEG